MQESIYNKEGKKVGTATLPEHVFGLPWNGDLVHQVVVGMQSNARTPIAHAQDRSEVRGGGKKPWRQKGTGRARHGSSRSPIWRGGGVTFGPRNDKDYSKKINRKMKQKALFTVLSQKARDKELILLDDLTFPKPKTAEAKNTLVALSSAGGFSDLAGKKKNAALFALNSKNDIAKMSFRNMGNVEVDEVRNLNPADVLLYKYLVITKPDESLKVLADKLPLKGAVKKTPTKKKAVSKKAPAKKKVAKKVVAKKR